MGKLLADQSGQQDVRSRENRKHHSINELLTALLFVSLGICEDTVRCTRECEKKVLMWWHAAALDVV